MCSLENKKLIYKCKVCSVSVQTIDSFCCHVNRHVQFLTELECPSCDISFFKVSKLKTHLKENHSDLRISPENIQSPEDIENRPIETEGSDEDHVKEPENEDGDISSGNIVELNAPDKELNAPEQDLNSFEKTMDLFLKLSSRRNIALKTAEETMQSFQKFMTEYLNSIEKKMSKETSVEDMISTYKIAKFEINSSMERLNTIPKLRTAASKYGYFRDPYRFTIRSNTIEILGDIEEKKSFGTMMPIIHQIKSFLEKPKVLSTILQNQEKIFSKEGLFENVISGSLWKKIKEQFGEKTVIPIHFYNDDFKVDNPVGPHSSDTKLSVFYYHFPTLPDFLATNINVIFLAMLYLAKDLDDEEVKSTGVDPSLFALWSVLSPLENEGIDIEAEGKTSKVYIVMSQFYGDNLALNTLFGFDRGFSGDYSCRACIIPKNMLMKSSTEIPSLIRNETNFKQCLQGKSKEERKGVKYDSSLNKFNHFKGYKNFTGEIMHDGLLGTFKEGILEALIFFIIKKQTFNIDMFNDCKENFDYGKKNIGNKTANISRAQLINKKLRMNAKEIWTILEVLPLIFMQLVPDYRHCKVYNYILKMVDLLHHITKKTYTEDDIDELGAVVEDHHKTFMSVFSVNGNPKRLTPKFHAMTHYKRLIRLYGPLRNSMVFKFEFKHQYLKQYAQVCFSRVDLPFTLAKKFCFEFAQFALSSEDIFHKIKDVNISNAVNFEIVNDPPMQYTDIKFAKSLRYKGMNFEIGDIVFYKSLQYQVEAIGFSLERSHVILDCEELETTYEDITRSWKINNHTGVRCQINVDKLRSSPVNIHRIRNVKYFVYKN